MNIRIRPRNAQRAAFFRYVCGSRPAWRSVGSVAAQTRSVPSTVSPHVTKISGQSQERATPPFANARASSDRRRGANVPARGPAQPRDGSPTLIRPPRWRSESAFADALYLPVRSQARSLTCPLGRRHAQRGERREVAARHGRLLALKAED